MSDIVERIKSLRYVHVPVASQLFEEAIVEITSLRGDAEIARLRLESAHAEIVRLREAIRRVAEQDATLSVQDGNVTVTMDATLTDAERYALRDAAESFELDDDDKDCARVAATLRGLLERMK